MKLEIIPISKLKLLENNPRTISKDQMEKLCKSIKDDPDFLNARPILVNKSNEIYTVYAGNQRVRAAKKLKMKEIPCVVDEDLDSEVMKKRTILDNKTFGEFDFDILANEYDINMLIDCGFTPEELLGDISKISDDEINPSDDVDEQEEKHKCDKCGQKIKKGKK